MQEYLELTTLLVRIARTAQQRRWSPFTYTIYNNKALAVRWLILQLTSRMESTENSQFSEMKQNEQEFKTVKFR